MSLLPNSKEITVVGVRASTIALFEATFAGAIGLGIAVLYALRVAINLGHETSSVLAGLSFGLTAGIIGVIVLPLVYFAIGWLIGYVHGWVFNVIVGETKGIVLFTKK